MAKKNPRSKSRVAAAPEPVRPAKDVSTDLGETIRKAAPDIVESLIDEAKKGNCTPAKFLFDFAGLHSAAAPASAAEEGLAARLLKELARPPEEGAESPGTIQ